MIYDMRECGSRIRQLRVKAGLTQEKAANALNIDQSFYTRVESGKKGCSVDLLIQMSALFGVSLDYLILGKYPSNLLEKADTAQLKAAVQDLVDQLERFMLSI